MSIIIQNIDKAPRQTGRHEYQVRINREHIVCFSHNREDGLATCLRRAASAVQRSGYGSHKVNAVPFAPKVKP